MKCLQKDSAVKSSSASFSVLKWKTENDHFPRVKGKRSFFVLKRKTKKYCVLLTENAKNIVFRNVTENDKNIVFRY